MIRTLNVDTKTMQVNVTIGVQRPEQVDADKVIAVLPVGQVSVKVVKGGLDVPDDETGDLTVIASPSLGFSPSRRSRLIKKCGRKLW